MSEIRGKIDLKSFLIGFLLAAVAFLFVGAGNGVQEVKIVGISTYDSLSIKIDDVSSSVEVPIKLNDISYSIEFPVKIKK